MSQTTSPAGTNDAAQLTVSGQGIAQKADDVRILMADKPYIWGGKTTNGFDCSGYVSYVFKQLFPSSGSLYQLSAAGFASSTLFNDVTDTQARRAGDIIYFPAHNGSPAHVGIFYDGVTWIGSQSAGVRKVAFNNSWWGARPKKIRRLAAISVLSMDAGRGVAKPFMLA